MMKMIAVGVGLLAVFSIQSASSQELTDGQRRRLHLPYVRATTDCYARAIEANTSALDLARENRWYDAISATGNVCNQALATMVDAHDRLYGPGTGLNFAKGPYLDDLPRAIGVRLREALARRANEVAQVEASRRQRVEDARRARDLLRDRMYACTTKELESLVASSESADVLTTAAMTICNRDVQAALDAAVELARLESGSTVDFRDDLVSVVRKNVLASAVQAKAGTKQVTTKPQAQPTAVQPSARAPSTFQAPEECLKTASSLRKGQLVDQEKLISMMLDICRPEIENAARTKFLEDPTQTLADLRTEALESAVKFSKTLLSLQ